MKKTILITGGTSGIGKGIAKYFYKKGWNVLITGRNKNKLKTVAQEMPGINLLEYNSLDDHSMDRLIEFIQMQWGGQLDILINNGGHVALEGIKAITRTSMLNMYQAHLISPTILTSRCLEFLSLTKGHILNITSSHGIKPYAQTSAYASAKAGLNMLTKIWALELAPLGIRVNAIAPGPTNTPILESAGMDSATIATIHDTEAAAIPLQRRGEVTDIVAAATFLLDSGSSWATGVILPIDGGISIS